MAGAAHTEPYHGALLPQEWFQPQSNQTCQKAWKQGRGHWGEEHNHTYEMSMKNAVWTQAVGTRVGAGWDRPQEIQKRPGKAEPETCCLQSQPPLEGDLGRVSSRAVAHPDHPQGSGCVPSSPGHTAKWGPTVAEWSPTRFRTSRLQSFWPDPFWTTVSDAKEEHATQPTATQVSKDAELSQVPSPELHR